MNTRQQLWVSQSLKDNNIKGCPASQQVLHAKELSLHNGHEWRVYVKICSPDPLMVTSPYEWKTLEKTPQKQINKNQQIKNVIQQSKNFI